MADQTVVTGINDKGEVSGGWFEADTTPHSFILSKDGKLTSFDQPSANFQINNRGDGVLNYPAGGSLEPSFFRSKEGVITPLSVPGALSTTGVSLNSEGEVTGYYFSDPGPPENYQGFLRSPDGVFTLLGEIFPSAINNAGAITGGTSTSAFVRSSKGEMDFFTVPGASSTFPTSINDSGAVAGRYRYTVGSVEFHGGFIRK